MDHIIIGSLIVLLSISLWLNSVLKTELVKVKEELSYFKDFWSFMVEHSANPSETTPLTVKRRAVKAKMQRLERVK